MNVWPKEGCWFDLPIAAPFALHRSFPMSPPSLDSWSSIQAVLHLVTGKYDTYLEYRCVDRVRFYAHVAALSRCQLLISYLICFP